MNTGLRITAFAAALAATFGTAYGVGKGVDPVVSDTPESAESAPARHDSHTERVTGSRRGDEGGQAAAPAGGLQISEGGYTLDLRTPGVTAGQRADLRFVIRDEDGRAVTAFQREHDKELHLIVASRDLVTYRHLHPTRAADGTWSTPVDLPEAGDYRVFADFTPAGKDAENLTLGADLAASGTYKPKKLPAQSDTAEVNGYEVELTGGLRPGAAGELKLKVSRDGRPVTDLQPYLGAYGHLVALRSGDLAYLHVHPQRRARRRQDRTRPGRLLHGHRAQRRRLPPVPRLQARGQGPHGRVHGPDGRGGHTGGAARDLDRPLPLRSGDAHPAPVAGTYTLSAITTGGRRSPTRVARSKAWPALRTDQSRPVRAHDLQPDRQTLRGEPGRDGQGGAARDGDQVRRAHPVQIGLHRGAVDRPSGTPGRCRTAPT